MLETFTDTHSKMFDIQTSKNTCRGLTQYNTALFANDKVAITRADHSAYLSFSKYVQEVHGIDLHQCEKLEDLIRKMKVSKGSQIVWTDMCGGFGIAAREFNSKFNKDRKTTTILVDLFDWQEISKYSDKTRYAIYKIYSRTGINIFDPQFSPSIMVKDAKNVILEKKADLITCIQGIQYIPDKLGAIVNWYNQLENNGLLIISNPPGWPKWISKEGKSNKEGNLVFQEFIRVLKESGIKVSINIHRMHLMKKPGTTLELNCTLQGTSPIWGDYCHSEYSLSEPSTAPINVITEVTRQTPPASPAKPRPTPIP